MLLFYVRHGDPIYKPDSLTELGKEQAQALVNRMKVCSPQRIFASSSERAIMTAHPTATYLGKEIEILDWCNEQYAFNEFSVESENGSRKWGFADEKTKKILVGEEIRRLDKESRVKGRQNEYSIDEQQYLGGLF